MSITWTDETVETLKALWAQGLTGGEIGARLGGLSRSAVLGKLHRLGGLARPQSQGAPSPPPARERVAAGGLATTATLQAHMCKWPIGDPAEAGFGYCGAAAAPGRPYCPGHSRSAYQRAPRLTHEGLAAELARLEARRFEAVTQ